NSCGTAGISYGAPIAPGAPVIQGGPAPKGEPIPAPKDAQPLPKGQPKQPAPVSSLKQVQSLVPQQAAPALSAPATETKNPFELDRRYESRVARAPDYGWLTGQLFYVHADGGLWVLRYAPLWKEDPNGGSVVLARDLRMESYREGDLVTVHGELLSQQRS